MPVCPASDATLAVQKSQLLVVCFVENAQNSRGPDND